MKKNICFTLLDIDTQVASGHLFKPFESGAKCERCDLLLTKKLLKKIKKEDNLNGNLWIK